MIDLLVDVRARLEHGITTALVLVGLVLAQTKATADGTRRRTAEDAKENGDEQRHQVPLLDSKRALRSTSCARGVELHRCQVDEGPHAFPDLLQACLPYTEDVHHSTDDECNVEPDTLHQT